MCDLCNNDAPRTYTHSRTSQHKKLLRKLMKKKKADAIAKYGYYKWEI